ncbi:MAG: hypothetical protein KTR25_20150, partial [Myxococcales bacterium]|nr:hypothetical protein [Myxococcales bacterium]
NYKAKNPGANRMGINMYLFADSELSGVELRFPDGKNWFGGPTRTLAEADTVSSPPPEVR